MWAKIIKIKRTKDLNYFSLCALSLFNTRVSQFELNFWNKWTFSHHSNWLRCTCTYFLKYRKCVLLIRASKAFSILPHQLKWNALLEPHEKNVSSLKLFLLIVKESESAFRHLSTVHSSLNDNTPISERTYSFFNRWVQNISDKAATEFLPQLLDDPKFVVAGWCISAALWAAGKQHEKSLQASPASGLQALQPQQEVPKAAPHQLTAWKVSTTDSLSLHCCGDKYSDT